MPSFKTAAIWAERWWRSAQSLGSSPSLPRAARSGAGAARGDRITRAAIAGALGLLTCVALLPCLDNGFVATWDDGPNLLENARLRTLDGSSLAWAWRTFLLGVYQPLAWWLFLAEYAVWGLRPWGYHLVSLLWHAANAILVFHLTCALLERARPDLAAADRTFGAALAAALFAVHPLRVEVVAWASCQPYLPCVFFCLLALLVYLRASSAGSDRLRLLVLAWVLFLVALGFKSLAVPLPFVMLVLDVYPLRRLGAGRGPAARGVWLEKLPFFLLAGLFAAIAYWARSSVEVVTRPRSLSARVAQACYAVAYYPIETLVPTGLTPFHPISARVNLGTPWFQACAAGVVVLSLALLLLRRRRPGLSAAWVSYLLCLAPSSGIVAIGSMLVADRYSYLATIAGFVLAAAAFATLRTRGSGVPLHRVVAVLGLTLLVSLLPLTWRQCRIWRSSEAAWADSAARFAEAVRADPASAEAHHNLGMALFYCRRFDEAIAQFQRALALDPALASAQGSLGQALIESGRPDEAMAALAEAERLDPENPEVHGALASLWIQQRRLERAQAEYREALKREPNRAIWHAGLGVVFFRQGDLDAAAAELAEAVRLDPDDLRVQDQLRQVRRRQGRR
jgi:Flp pilus assembly protein TadD